MCDPHRHCMCFSSVPGSPHRHQSPSSHALTKTRSTSSRQVQHSALSNYLAPCTSPQLQNLKRTRTTQRRAPAQRPRGLHCSVVPPLRSPRAPAQMTLRRRLDQRLQTRQIPQPLARPEQSWPLASGSMLATTNHHH